MKNLRDIAKEICVLYQMASELDEKVQQSKRKLIEAWHEVDDVLDGDDPFKDNPIVKEMRNGNPG